MEFSGKCLVYYPRKKKRSWASKKRYKSQVTRTTVSMLLPFSIYCCNGIKSFDGLLRVGNKETHLLVVACHKDSNLCLELEAGKPQDKFHMTQHCLHSTTPASSCELHSSFLLFFKDRSTAYILKISPCSDHSKTLKLTRKKNITEPMQRFF